MFRDKRGMEIATWERVFAFLAGYNKIIELLRKWAGHVAQMKVIKVHTLFCREPLKEASGRLMLEQIGLSHNIKLRSALVKMLVLGELRFYEMQEIFCLSKQPFFSPEGLCSMSQLAIPIIICLGLWRKRLFLSCHWVLIINPVITIHFLLSTYFQGCLGRLHLA